MKVFLAIVAVLATAEAASLGGEQCRKDPGYWCGSVQAATSCHAFSLCLKNVWKPQHNLLVIPTRECIYSQKAVKTVRYFLAKDQEQDAAFLIASMCSIIHEDAWRRECKVVVTEFWPQLMDLMGSGTEPATVATVMGMCKPVEEAAKKETEGSSRACKLCQLVVSSLDQLLSENRTEEAFQQALDEVCHKLPSGITEQCLSFVNEYAAMVLQLLVQEELEPHQVCLALTLCQSSSAAPVPALSVPSVRAGGLCTVCEVVVGMLEEMLARNKSEEDIEKDLDKVCSLLPSSLSSICINMVKDYLPVIIDLIEQKLQPSEVCEKIKLCNSSALAVPEALLKAAQPGKAFQDPVKCTLCQIIISEINTLIGDNRSEQAIIKAVEEVCNILQGDLRLQCQSEVQNYGPAVLDLLQHMDDPKKVCSSLRLCSAASDLPPSRLKYSSRHKREGQRLLGFEKCTWGPTFWCAKMENARKCGMVQKCVETYGMKP